LDTHHVKNRSNSENSIRLESSGIQEVRQAEENEAKDNRGWDKKNKKIME
jgi:hypothetical protein